MTSSSLNLSPSGPPSYFNPQPPRSHPSEPPGSSITPSTDTNCDTTTLPISSSCSSEPWSKTVGGAESRRLAVALRGRSASQRDLPEAQHDEQPERGDPRRDEEDGLQRVRDGLPHPVLDGRRHRGERLGARLQAVRVDLRGAGRQLARQPDVQPAPQHRPPDCHPRPAPPA